MSFLRLMKKILPNHSHGIFLNKSNPVNHVNPVKIILEFNFIPNRIKNWNLENA